MTFEKGHRPGRWDGHEAADPKHLRRKAAGAFDLGPGMPVASVESRAKLAMRASLSWRVENYGQVVIDGHVKVRAVTRFVLVATLGQHVFDVCAYEPAVDAFVGDVVTDETTEDDLAGMVIDIPKMLTYYLRRDADLILESIERAEALYDSQVIRER